MSLSITQRNNLKVKVRTLIFNALKEGCADYEIPEGCRIPGWTEFDVFSCEPELVNKLVNDLINTILGIDAGNFIMIPSLEEAEDIVRLILPYGDGEDEDFIKPGATHLIEMLKGEAR